jgi:hypothetical protein
MKNLTFKLTLTLFFAAICLAPKASASSSNLEDLLIDNGLLDLGSAETLLESEVADLPSEIIDEDLEAGESYTYGVFVTDGDGNQYLMNQFTIDVPAEEEETCSSLELTKGYSAFSKKNSEDYELFDDLTLEEIYELNSEAIYFLYYYDPSSKRKWNLYYPRFTSLKDLQIDTSNQSTRLFIYSFKDSEVEICKVNSSFDLATEEEEEEKVEVTIALKKNKYTIYGAEKSENYQYLEGMSLEEIFELSPKDIAYLYYYDGEAKKWQLYWPKYARYSKNTADIKITANHSDNKLALMGKKNGVVKFEVVR